MAYNQQGALPPSAAPDQPYGEAGKQLAAQEQVPMAPPPGTPPAAPSMPPGLEPGALGGLADPSGRPTEPITAGIRSGPGPGPEVLTSTPRRRGEDLLRLAAEETGDPFLAALMRRMSR